MSSPDIDVEHEVPTVCSKIEDIAYIKKSEDFTCKSRLLAPLENSNDLVTWRSLLI